MMSETRELWQPAAVAQVRALLEADPDVLALVLYGSVARDVAALDLTSDVDLLVIFREVGNKRVEHIWSNTPLARIVMTYWLGGMSEQN